MGGGPFHSLTAAPRLPCAVPTAYVRPDGPDSRQQIQLLKNRAARNLIGSAQLPFVPGHEWTPLGLISLRRAEGTGPPYESVAQNKLVCLAPCLIVLGIQRELLSATI